MLVGVVGVFELPKRLEVGRGVVTYDMFVPKKRPPVDVVLENREGLTVTKFDDAEVAAAEGRALEEFRWAELWLKSNPE